MVVGFFVVFFSKSESIRGQNCAKLTRAHADKGKWETLLRDVQAFSDWVFHWVTANDSLCVAYYILLVCKHTKAEPNFFSLWMIKHITEQTNKDYCLAVFSQIFIEVFCGRRIGCTGWTLLIAVAHNNREFDRVDPSLSTSTEWAWRPTETGSEQRDVFMFVFSIRLMPLGELVGSTRIFTSINGNTIK